MPDIKSLILKTSCCLALLITIAGSARADDGVVEATLAARGLDADALGLIDNILAHDAIAEPIGVGAGVRALLVAPHTATTVVDALQLPPSMANTAPPLAWTAPDDLPDAAGDFITHLVDGLLAVRARLHGAISPTCCDTTAMIETLRRTGQTAPALVALAEGLHLGALDGAVRAALSFERRLVDQAATDEHLVEALATLPGRRFSSPAGTVVIAGAEDNDHAARAAIILDVGGQDSYDMAAIAAGGPALVIDFAGNDHYRTGAVAMFDLVIQLDLAGDDIYRAPDAGDGAAVGGIAIVHDLAGDDFHEASHFAQGAAIGGFAVLIDDAGDDRYRIGSRGQGFGGPLGFGALIDRAGADDYLAAEGFADPFARSGGTLSYVQGVGVGYRGSLAGGVGLLRDHAGDDRYQADMFAQGSGYYYGLGVLDDRRGNDSYAATRYGQGMGAHAGIGVLRDRQGDDGYWLSVGVGQGMGLDTAVGVLDDGAGDDRYQAATLAQGASTGSGFGLLRDRAGSDVYALDAPGEGWGRGRRARGLISLSFLIDESEGHDGFHLAGAALDDPAPRALGGPLAGRDDELPPAPRHACPEPGADGDDFGAGDPVVDWLSQAAPLFGIAEGDGGAYYARLWAGLPAIAPDLLVGVKISEVSLAVNLETLLRCYLAAADEPRRAALERVFIDAIASAAPQSALALGKLQTSPPEPAISLAVADMVQARPSCATRAAGLVLARKGAANDANLAAALTALAARALADPCWQTQAAAAALWRAVTGEMPAGSFASPVLSAR